jgi:hypothetical protein
VCFAFQKGKCARGDGCKFGHGGGDTPSEALSDEVGGTAMKKLRIVILAKVWHLVTENGP